MMKPQFYLLQVHTDGTQEGHISGPPATDAHSTPEAREHVSEEHAASTEHASPHHEELTLTEWLNETNIVSFALVAVFLYIVFAKAGVIGKVAGYREKVARDIEAVEAQKKQAQEELDAIQKRVSSLSAEVDTIIADAKKSASGLTEQILKDARSQAEKIVETAKSRVELEQRAAARDLEKRLLADALSDARADLARNLSANDQKRSVETFIRELSEIK